MGSWRRQRHAARAPRGIGVFIVILHKREEVYT